MKRGRKPGFKVSKKTREKIRKAAIGRIFSEKAKLNMRLAKLGKKRIGYNVEKWKKSRKGYKHSEETKRKIGNAQKGKSRPYQKGEKNGSWKGGVTPINQKIRSSLKYKKWTYGVFKRDNWTCQKTKIKGCKLVAHHIQNFSEYPELRFVIDNGITLSKESHKLFHHIYGKKRNTKEQLLEFIN